jgi:hypothetical protein
MITDLESAIKHCEEVAEKNEKQASYIYIKEGNPYYENYAECASEHRQLAEWLKTLKEIWDSGDCNDCGNRGCLYKPKLGHLVRYNCPFYSKEVNVDVNT